MCFQCCLFLISLQKSSLAESFSNATTVSAPELRSGCASEASLNSRVRTDDLSFVLRLLETCSMLGVQTTFQANGPADYRPVLGDGFLQRAGAQSARTKQQEVVLDPQATVHFSHRVAETVTRVRRQHR